jgi:hypothetical protein
MWKGHVSYYFWGLNEIKSYSKQNNSSLFKTYANFSWFKVWASGMSNHREKKGAYWLLLCQIHEIWIFLWKILQIEPLTNTINTIL